MAKVASEDHLTFLSKQSTATGTKSSGNQKMTQKKEKKIQISDTDDALDAVKSAMILADLMEHDVVILDDLTIMTTKDSAKIDPNKVLEVVRYQAQDIHDVGPMW